MMAAQTSNLEEAMHTMKRVAVTTFAIGALGAAPLVIAGSTAAASAASRPTEKTYVPGAVRAGGVESLGVTNGGVESLARPGAISYGGFEGL
jgi:hypothetical protein